MEVRPSGLWGAGLGGERKIGSAQGVESPEVCVRCRLQVRLRVSIDPRTAFLEARLPKATVPPGRNSTLTTSARPMLRIDLAEERDRTENKEKIRGLARPREAPSEELPLATRKRAALSPFLSRTGHPCPVTVRPRGRTPMGRREKLTI